MWCTANIQIAELDQAGMHVSLNGNIVRAFEGQAMRRGTREKGLCLIMAILATPMSARPMYQKGAVSRRADFVVTGFSMVLVREEASNEKESIIEAHPY
jgi:hypothetical protein